MGKYKKQPWYIYALAAIIFLTVTFSDWLSQHKVVFVIDIAVLLVLAFGILLFSSLKEWKKSDEEILAGFARKNLIQQAQPVTPRRLIFGAISGLAVFLFIISDSGPMPRPVKIIFSIAVVIVTAVNLFVLLEEARYPRPEGHRGTPGNRGIFSGAHSLSVFLRLYRHRYLSWHMVGCVAAGTVLPVRILPSTGGRCPQCLPAVPCR